MLEFLNKLNAFSGNNGSPQPQNGCQLYDQGMFADNLGEPGPHETLHDPWLGVDEEIAPLVHYFYRIASPINQMQLSLIRIKVGPGPGCAGRAPRVDSLSTLPEVGGA